jgi:hypothetical protein
MNRWLTDFNDMLSRFETQNAPAELSPYFYLADMSRWFLALQPFSSGNAEVIQALMDYATTRLELPALTTIELDSSPFTTVSENRNNTLDKLKENLTFLEGCLFETKTKPISLECSVLK